MLRRCVARHCPRTLQSHPYQRRSRGNRAAPTDLRKILDTSRHRLAVTQDEAGASESYPSPSPATQRSDAAIGSSVTAESSRNAPHLPKAVDLCSIRAFPFHDRLVVNSRTREVHLNARQESTIWKLRQDQYHRCLHRIVVVLQSHLTVEEKCHRILLLHDRVVIPQRLRLRSDTYEEVFHLYYVNANHAIANASSDAGSSNGPSGGRSSSLPKSGTSSSAAFLDAVWTMYRYMIDSGTNPTPAIIQHVMGVLDRVTTRNANVEAKAHSLMMDCDRFAFPPTNFTLESYCAICEANRAMHLALARVTDTMTRHEQQGTGGVFQRLLHGLVVNGQVDFALRVIQQLNNVSLTDGLLDTALFAMRHSSQPEAAIAMYRSVVGSRSSGASRRSYGGGGGVAPTSLTISILIGVLSDDVVDVEVVRRHLPFVVGEMLRHRVPTSNETLNRVLHGYHRIGDRASFAKFLRSMRQRNKRVFEEQFPSDWLKLGDNRTTSVTTVAAPSA